MKERERKKEIEREKDRVREKKRERKRERLLKDFVKIINIKFCEKKQSSITHKEDTSRIT